LLEVTLKSAEKYIITNNIGNIERRLLIQFIDIDFAPTPIDLCRVRLLPLASCPMA
jgi:hypothetical protein